MKNSCRGVVTSENLVGPVQFLQLSLFTLPNLCRHLIFLTLCSIEVLSGIILGRVVKSLRGGCDVGHRFPTARNFYLLSRICY